MPYKRLSNPKFQATDWNSISGFPDEVFPLHYITEPNTLGLKLNREQASKGNSSLFFILLPFFSISSFSVPTFSPPILPTLFQSPKSKSLADHNPSLLVPPPYLTHMGKNTGESLSRFFRTGVP